MTDDSRWRWLTESWARLRLADAADILVVSILAYAAIVWFQKTRSRFVVAGFAALVALYFAAQLFDMHLTLALFRVVIGFALIALVVIFQEQIRRGFERIASARPFRVGGIEGRNDLVEIVTRSIARLAHEKTGALVAFKGTTPLERHIEGGVSIDAAPSEPLFFSLFDPHSAGHDGAVVIDGGRLTKFAVHLPLSQSPASSHLGTRHCAAVGLSEYTDAFVVVVSEERGTISLAVGGRLERVTASELSTRLARFLEQSFPEKRRSFWQRAFTENIGTKTLAVGLAIVAWWVVAREETELVARTFEVPVQYLDVQPDVVLDEPRPAEIRVTLQASLRDFRTIDPGSLSVSIDAKRLEPGYHSIPLDPRNVIRPRDVEVQKLSPANVVVHAEAADEEGKQPPSK